MGINRQLGFSLIEVLISIFVLALGVIGAAGMQLVAARTSQQSALQSVAVQLATEMADKMRSNGKQMNQDDSANPFIFEHDSAADDAPTEPGKFCYGSAGCSDAEVAEFDIYNWTMQLRQALPGGKVKVCRDASPWSTADSRLQWDCSYTASTGNNAPFVIKVGWQGKNPDGTLIRDADKKFPPAVAITVEPYVK
ncbi:MAG: type IV pilus modification protein PilV [Burkholderiaceae bacterium]